MKAIKKFIDGDRLNEENELSKISNSACPEFFAALYGLGEAVVYMENLGDGGNQWFLDGDDLVLAKKDPEKWLRATVDGFEFYDHLIESLEWGCTDLESEKATPGDCGLFQIISASYFSTCGGVITKYHRVDEPDGSYTPVEFEKYEDAKKWLNEYTDGPTYLSHGEIQGPDFAIVNT